MTIDRRGPDALIAASQAIDARDDLTLLDVRWDLAGSRPEDYAQGHAPGAVFVDLERELSDGSVPPEQGGRHPLPTAEAFTEAARGWGLDADRPVVVMDGGGGVPAARAWWLLRNFGCTDVRVLDGGFPAWRAAGGPVVAGAAAPPPRSTFVARAGGMPVVDTDRIGAALDRGIVLDARTPERFRGEVEPVDPVPGRIPGSLNLPAADLLGPDGHLLSTDRLAALLADVGDPDPTPVVAACGSGVTAALTVLACWVVDRPAALFPGSYSWWCRQPDLQIATGP
jgi:thiosulfate/3-mercaptopyruvate sulfurtransferase